MSDYIDEQAVVVGRAAIAAYENYSRHIGVFDYSNYGAEKPHVIRDYRKEKQTLLATTDSAECDTEWERVVANYVGLACLEAARSESEDTQRAARIEAAARAVADDWSRTNIGGEEFDADALTEARAQGAADERERLAKLAEDLPELTFQSTETTRVLFEPHEWVRYQKGEG